MQNPIVSNYAVFLGASIAVAGLMVGLNPLASLILRPISGLVTDLIDKKHILVVSIALYIVASFGCALSSSVALVGLFRIILGAGYAFWTVASMSMVPYIVSPSVLGRAMGWFGAANMVSSAIGPTIGAWISNALGYPMTFAAAGVVQLVGLILAVTYKGSPPRERQAASLDDYSAIKKPRLQHLLHQLKPSKLFNLSVLPLTAVAATGSIAFSTLVAFVLMVGEMRGVEGAYLYFTVYTLISVSTKPFSGRLYDRFGIKFVIIPAYCISITGMLVLSFESTLLGILIGGACLGCGQGASWSALQAESLQRAKETEIGRSANTFFIGPDLGMFVGPFIGGAILQWFGIASMFLFIAAVLVFGLVLFLFVQRVSLDGRKVIEKQSEQ